MKQLDNWMMTGVEIKIPTSNSAKYSLIIINFGQLQMLYQTCAKGSIPSLTAAWFPPLLFSSLSVTLFEAKPYNSVFSHPKAAFSSPCLSYSCIYHFG